MRASEPLAVSPFLLGDPVRLSREVASAAELLATLGLEASGPVGVVGLAPGVALVHALLGREGDIALRWVTLPETRALDLGSGPAPRPWRLALVLTAPLRESGRALRLVARLGACLAEPELVTRACAVTTREALVALLTPAEAAAGESPLATADLLVLLHATPDGLSADEAARRLTLAGPNRLERVRRRPLLLGLLEQVWSFFAVLLWVGGALAFLAGLPELGWAIFAVIIINGIFSFFQEYRAERAVEALQELLPPTATVRRGGAERRVPAAELVPGDLVRLEEGDQVPADAQLVEASGLRVDQSPLTGESHPIFKLPLPVSDLGAAANHRRHAPAIERPELVFAGTGVVAGSATVVLRATGMATEIGGIAHLTQAVAEEPSPLQREMVRVTRVVTALAVAFGVTFFALGVSTGTVSVAEGLVFALGVIVANVPEGLLPTLTLALALGVQRMATQRSLVKRLSSVETLGATTVICTDKTGTLTRNRMAVHVAWVSEQAWVFSEAGGDEAGGKPPPEVRELLAAAVLASQATAERGDPTEVALVRAAIGSGVEIEPLRHTHPLRVGYPFDSFRKRMTLVRAAGGGDLVAYVKGAPAETLRFCTAVRWHGQDVPLSDARRAATLAEQDRLAADGLRVLAVAVRPVPDTLVGAAVATVERELVLLGLLALWDPPRPEVADAIGLCRRAGIRVVMVTGDYGLTARAIARQIGLEVTRVVTGEEIEQLAPATLRRLAAEPGVLFARTSPAHKLTIVTTLRALGEVVAVTGDGVNDAPALKAADIGVAMGQRGSDVAKEAAVMVITDDNFASIVAAIRLGRAIYANVGKFISYIFASNVPELVPFLAFVFLGLPLPLTVMQILAVDLGTDLLPALALGAEPPEPGVMDRPPRPRHTRLLDTGRLLHAYGFLGVIEAALSLAAFYWSYRLAGWRPGRPMAATGVVYRRATTMTLAGIVAAQVGNIFACRTERESVFSAGLFANRLVLLGIAAEIGLLGILILVPPLPAIFGLEPLQPAEWAFLLPFPLIVLGLEEGRKAVLRVAERRRRPAPPNAT